MARCVRRDRKKEVFWRRMVRGQVGSGRSIRAWCRQHGLRESAFYWWRAELARRGVAAPPPTFKRVWIAEEPAAGAAGSVSAAGRIEIVLAQGRQVRVVGPVDRRALRDVLSVLGESVPEGAEAVGTAAARSNGRVAEALGC